MADDKLPKEIREQISVLDSDMKEFVDKHIRKFTNGKKNMVADSVAIMSLMQISSSIDQLTEHIAFIALSKIKPTEHCKGVIAACRTIDTHILSVCKALGSEDEVLRSYIENVIHEKETKE